MAYTPSNSIFSEKRKAGRLLEIQWGIVVASLPSSATVISFDNFQADLRSRELRREGVKVRLPDQSFQVLAMLLERPSELVTREEIRKRLWPGDTFVDFDHGLNNAVNRLRDALGDAAASPRYIETLPRRGYRFIAPLNNRVPRSTGVLPAESLPSITQAAQFGQRKLAVVAALTGVFLLATLTTSVWYVRWRAKPIPITSLAVLPLENVSGDPSQDYFADGMTDVLITNLAGLKSVRVISRTSAMHYKGTRKSLPEIARELDVDAVVEGTVSRSGDRVRINAQLVDARRDRHLWAATYERDLRDVLALQAELAEAVSHQVSSRSDPQPRSLRSERKVDPESYEAYLRGRYEAAHGAFTTEGWRKAREFFNRAIQLDPGNAAAVVGLADTYIPEDMATARLLASQALELDGSLAEAHAIMAITMFAQDWNFAAAEKEFRFALELDPNSVPTRSWYGTALAQTGRFDDALRVLQQAEHLDPLSPNIGSDIGLALYLAHRYDEATEQELKVLRQYPDDQRANQFLMRIYERRGHIPEAIAAFAGAPAWYDLTPGQAQTIAQQWRETYARGGTPAYWRARLAFELPRHGRGAFSYYALVRVYALSGDSNRAIAMLQEAYGRRDPMLIAWIRTDPQLDNLRSDPRFQALLKQVGVSQ